MFLFHNRNVITKEFYREEKEEEQLDMTDPQTSLISQLKQFHFTNNTTKHTQLQCDKICLVKNK